MYRKLVKYTLTLGMLTLCGCAATPHSGDTSALEKYNRTMFTINNKIDKAVIRPVAKGSIWTREPNSSADEIKNYRIDYLAPSSRYKQIQKKSSDFLRDTLLI